MNKSLLITRPKYDLVTTYLCAWSENVIAVATVKRIPVYDLKEDKAIRNKFESYIKAHSPTFIFLNGHGNTKLLAGHNNEIILDRNSKIGGGIMYARSCEVAVVLGKGLVPKQIDTFIGYTRKFVFGYQNKHISSPLTDGLAKLFLEPSNNNAIVLLKGHNAHEAHKRSLTQMYKNFRKMLSSNATYEERFAARWLWSNLKSQVLIGNKNQTI